MRRSAANEALRRVHAESRHRAEQIGLLSSVAHRISAIREPEELMQQTADQIRARMNHTYVAVVVLDDDRALVGRWAGPRAPERRPRAGLPRRDHRPRPAPPSAAGRGRREPRRRPHADVPGMRSEIVIPLFEASELLGVLDFQSEQPFASALDDVAAGETLAEFLVIALPNAPRHQEARKDHP